MSNEVNLGGPSRADREFVYAKANFDVEAIDQVEKMIAGSGRRQVGRAALTNVLVRHYSLKNAAPRVLESHACELVHAYELELDPAVIGYYVQVPCLGVKRLTSQGRRHISAAHLDFMVFYEDRVTLVESKTRRWLAAKSTEDPDWSATGGEWTYAPYRYWAEDHGLKFEVWASPDEVGVYRQNLEAMYSALPAEFLSEDSKLAAGALRALRGRPLTIAALSDAFPGFGARHALRLLALRQAFGPLRSRQVANASAFHPCLDPLQAQCIDESASAHQRSSFAELDISDPLLLASATDVEKAKIRLSRLAEMEAGVRPKSRRMIELARKVQRTVHQGGSALSACLTGYAQSGNRTDRLDVVQREAIETVIARHWHTGNSRFKKDLLFELEAECARRGVEPAGASRLYKRLRQEKEQRRALKTGGLRGFQAVRRRTDPRYRTLPPIGYGQVLHVDSSDLDVRIAPDLQNLLPSAKVKFYVGIDGATGDSMAHSLIFGGARSDGLALLMREYVRRHKMLPRVIHLDRGPENTARWISAFCDMRGITLRFSPTAGSAWNSQAESAIRQVNSQVAHRLPGSTEPDQMGRKVDGRFKSHRTAVLDFGFILDRFEEFFYGHRPLIPGADGRAPSERKLEALAALGPQGLPAAMDDDLKVQTSIAVSMKPRPDKRRGIATAEGWFCSNELLEALRIGDPVEVRSDCADPSWLYIKFRAVGWVKAFHSNVQQYAQMSDRGRLLQLLFAPYRRARTREVKAELSRVQNAKRAQIALTIGEQSSALRSRSAVPGDPDKTSVRKVEVGDAFEEEEGV